jgi:hypothetical protein
MCSFASGTNVVSARISSAAWLAYACMCQSYHLMAVLLYNHYDHSPPDAARASVAAVLDYHPAIGISRVAVGVYDYRAHNHSRIDNIALGGMVYEQAAASTKLSV